MRMSIPDREFFPHERGCLHRIASSFHTNADVCIGSRVLSTRTRMSASDREFFPRERVCLHRIAGSFHANADDCTGSRVLSTRTRMSASDRGFFSHDRGFCTTDFTPIEILSALIQKNCRGSRQFFYSGHVFQ